MFHPRPMLRVEFMVLQRDLSAVLHALARHRIFHVGDIEPADLEDVGFDLEGQHLQERCQTLETRLLRLFEAYGVSALTGTLLDPTGLGDWERWAEAEELALQRMVLRRRQLDSWGRYLWAVSRFLRALGGLSAEGSELLSLRVSCMRLGFLRPEATDELASLSIGYELHSLGQYRGERLVAILASSRRRERLDRDLGRLQFAPLPFPPALSGSLDLAAERVARLRSRLRRRRRLFERKLSRLRSVRRQHLSDLLCSVRGELRLLQARERFGFTRNVVVLGGWVPDRRVTELTAILEETCGARVVMRQQPASGDETPVLFFNPKLVRPFQRLLRVYGTPSYAEIEPTPVLALGFLVLFGMMFGDLGHGLAFVTAGQLLRRLSRFRDEGVILTEVGAFSALFGLLFGSVFGSEAVLAPLWFSPMHDIPRLMAAALGLGALLILLGLVLQLLNAIGHKAWRAILTDRFGVAGTLFYGGALLTGYLVYRGHLPPAAFVWLGIPLAAIFCHPLVSAADRSDWPLQLFEGAVEVLETVLGFLANTVSFLRVAAFGLAHVGLSMAVFAIAGQVAGLPLGLLWAALVHLFGNLVILGLEGLVVSVQTVRLEFYEVFSKFFRGGGVPYQPLALDGWAERRG